MEKLDKVIGSLIGCTVANCSNCEYGSDVCDMDQMMRAAAELLKEYRSRFYERSCQSCGNADYVHEYEIYLCRREDGCRWEPKRDV